MTSLVNVSTAELMTWIGMIWWPFVRFAALLWALPVFENPAVTPRARILLAVFLSFLAAPTLASMPAVDPFSLDAAMLTLEQIVFGVVLGVAIRMLFEVLSMVGLILSMQMGLSMAMMMDPGSGESVSLLGQLFWVMTALLFFALNGHLGVLAVLTDSFSLWPVGTSLGALNFGLLVQLFGWIFSAALLIALPGIIAMLLVNLTFGVAMRAAPSLNVFVLGFPMALLLGFVTVLLTLVQIGNQFSELTWYVLSVLRSVME